MLRLSHTLKLGLKSHPELSAHIPHLLRLYIQSEAHDLKADRVGFTEFRHITVSGDVICNNNLMEKRYDTKCSEFFSLHFCRSIDEQSNANALFPQLLQQFYHTVIWVYVRAMLLINAEAFFCHFVRVQALRLQHGMYRSCYCRIGVSRG